MSLARCYYGWRNRGTVWPNCIAGQMTGLQLKRWLPFGWPLRVDSDQSAAVGTSSEVSNSQHDGQ